MTAVEDVPRLGLIADCQYADKPDAPPRLYRRAADKLMAALAHLSGEALDALVHLGDFIDGDWSSYDALAPIEAMARPPLRHVLGNHDFHVPALRKADVPARLGLPWRRDAFDLGRWRILIADGNAYSLHAWPPGSARHRESQALHAGTYPDRPGWCGALGEAELDWLDAELAAADAAGRPALILCHYPVFPDDVHCLWDAGPVRARLNRHTSLKAWIAGHKHDGMYGQDADGVHHLTLKAMLDSEDTAYAIASLHPDRIDLTGFGRQDSLELRLR